MRLFTAITIPDEIKTKLQECFIPIKGVKWQEKSQMHLTLRFIGEVDSETAHEVTDELEKIKASPFTISLGGLGSFPAKEKGIPKVIWFGIQENNALAKLQDRIEQACQKAGLEPDNRTFKPHITLGRNKRAHSDEIVLNMEKMTVPDFDPIHVGKFSLFRSELNSGGARHYVEKTFRLS